MNIFQTIALSLSALLAPAQAPQPLPEEIMSSSCRVPPFNDCSKGPKRLCCWCENGVLRCH